jgi:hypothetical protein
VIKVRVLLSIFRKEIKMSLKRSTPCDTEGHCPYDASYNCDCEWYCGAEEPEDDCDYEVGYDPYCGCFTDDC